MRNQHPPVLGIKKVLSSGRMRTEEEIGRLVKFLHPADPQAITLVIHVISPRAALTLITTVGLGTLANVQTSNNMEKIGTTLAMRSTWVLIRPTIGFQS